MSKKCSTCKKLKSLTSFGNNKRNKDGMQGICKSCYAINWKAHYKKNKKKIRKYHKEKYYERSKEERSSIHKKNNLKFKPLRREYNQKRYNTPEGRYKSYEYAATRTGKEFKLTVEDFKELWDKLCHYCGDFVDGTRLDRVDNEVGYVKSNVVPCCFTCNKWKQAKTKEEFIEHCKKVADKAK